MENFKTKSVYLVLKKDVKETKENDKGEKRKYGVLSLYDIEKDKLIKIFIFDKYEETLVNYNELNQYEIELEVSVTNKDGKIMINYKILD